MSDGLITLLYKKGDRDDPRNYRPITLLNTDYKILTKVLVSRLKKVMDEFVSAPQTGFVPKRQITENTLLSRLIQSYLAEKDDIIDMLSNHRTMNIKVHCIGALV